MRKYLAGWPNANSSVKNWTDDHFRNASFVRFIGNSRLSASARQARTWTCNGPYAASKHAVVALAKTAAIEWAEHNIRVNCINPGPVNTVMMRILEEKAIAAGTTGIRERCVSIIPMKRFAEAEEIAKFARFLASDDSSYSTGATYLLDGGMLAGKMDFDRP